MNRLVLVLAAAMLALTNVPTVAAEGGEDPLDRVLEISCSFADVGCGECDPGRLAEADMGVVTDCLPG